MDLHYPYLQITEGSTLIHINKRYEDINVRNYDRKLKQNAIFINVIRIRVTGSSVTEK